MVGRSNKELAEFTEKTLGIVVLSNEYKILVALSELTYLSVKEISYEIRVSPATFQNKLNLLKLSGLIEWKKDLIDLRIRRYHLSDAAKSMLDDNFRKLNFAGGQGICNPAGEGLFDFTESLRKQLRIKIFSDEYKLVLILYDRGNLHTTDLLNLSCLSASSFYRSLGRIIDIGLAGQFPDPNDSRKTLNRIKGHIRIFMGEVHRELSDWAASI